MTRLGASGNGGSSAVNTVTAIINFGLATDPENDTTSTIVTVPWVYPGMILVATITGPTSDHDLEDSALEKINLSVGNIIDKVSFEVFAHAPNSSWGQYLINIIGV